MTEMFGEAWSPMSVPDLAPDDDDDDQQRSAVSQNQQVVRMTCYGIRVRNRPPLKKRAECSFVRSYFNKLCVC